MDFKGWMKLEEDDKTCTLQHPKGHQMKIALKALPAIHREQIKRLKFADGGDVLESGSGGISSQGEAVRYAHRMKRRGDSGSDQEIHYAKEEAKGRAQFEKQFVKPKLKGLAEGGEVENYDDGGEVRKSKGFWDSEHGKQALSAQNKEVENIRSRGKNVDAGKKNEVAENPHLNKIAPKVKHYEDGGGVHADATSPDDSTPDQSQTPAAAQPATVINIGAPQAQAPPSPPQSAAMQLAKAPVNVDQPVVPEGRPNLNPSGTENPSAIAENSQQAVKSQQDINAAAAKAQAELEQHNIEAQAQNQERLEGALANVKSHADAFAKYANNPDSINPKHFQESMSSGSKIAATLGLALGGLGVPFGGHNFAMDHLEKQIDRDIAAQKERMDTQKTVYGAYHQLYGDTAAAYNATKATMLDIYNAKAKQIALKLGAPQAQANYLKLSGDMAIEKSKLLQDSAVDLANLPGTRSGGQAAPQGTRQMPAGAPTGGAPGSAQPKGKNDKSVLNDSILHPGAEGAFRALQYTPKAKDQLSEITRQYTQAQQADKALKDINNTYLNLWKGANEGGVSGRIRRTVDPNMLGGIGGVAGTGIGALAGGIGAIPGAAIGAGVGEAIGRGAQVLTNTDINRRYDSDKSALLGYVSSALKGTNIGSGQIQEIVDANAPEYGDEPKTVAKKLKIIRDFIKNHTETSLLKTWHMTTE